MKTSTILAGLAAMAIGVGTAVAFIPSSSGASDPQLDRIEQNTCNILAHTPGAPPCAVADTTPPTTIAATTQQATTVPATTAPPTTQPATTVPATTAATTVTSVAATTAPTTAPPQTTAPTTTVAPNAPACGLVSAAFCETFDVPKGAGTRTGALDPVLWGVSRVGDENPGQQHANNIEDVALVGCGTTASGPPPGDVRICNGQMFEGMNDNHAVVNLDTYPKQPFDFAGRTGKVVFDVSGDSQGTHAAWPEFVITDKPVPGVRGSISLQVPQAAANEIGFALDGGCGTPSTDGTTGVGLVFMTKANVYSEPPFTTTGCITKGSSAAMNHIEVRVSQDTLEVWGTDAGGTVLRQLAVANGLNLGLTRGLVWLNDVHYNARKSLEPCECGPQWQHTFTWDSLGFDGPKTYRDLGFDVPDANVHSGTTTSVGYQVGIGPVTLTVQGVHHVQTPTAAQVVMNTYSFAQVIPSISINGGPWIDTPWPYPDAQTFSFRSISIPIPLPQVLDGTNTITMKSTDNSTTVANVSIILVAAAPVP